MAYNAAAAQAAAEAEAAAAAERAARRAALQAQYDEACKQRDIYEEHYHNALQAIYHLEVAKQGLDFMNDGQKKHTADLVENGVYPNNDLVEGLYLKGKNKHAENVGTALDRLYTKSSEYLGLYNSYKQQANDLYWQLMSV